MPLWSGRAPVQSLRTTFSGGQSPRIFSSQPRDSFLKLTHSISCSPSTFWPGKLALNHIEHPVDGLTHRNLAGANGVRCAPLLQIPSTNRVFR